MCNFAPEPSKLGGGEILILFIVKVGATTMEGVGAEIGTEDFTLASSRYVLRSSLATSVNQEISSTTEAYKPEDALSD